MCWCRRIQRAAMYRHQVRSQGWGCRSSISTCLPCTRGRRFGLYVWPDRDRLTPGLRTLFQFSRACTAVGHFRTMDGRTACDCNRLASALRVRLKSRRHQTDPRLWPPCLVWVGSNGARDVGAALRTGGNRVGCISHQPRNDLRVGIARWGVRTSQKYPGSGPRGLKDCDRHAGPGRNYPVHFAPRWRLERHRSLSVPIEFLHLAVPAVLGCLPRTLCLTGRAGANRRSGRSASRIRNTQEPLRLRPGIWRR